ncbi:hypothetical protein EBT31_13370 [bacterium]|nr:hypothetical protein [bacterium]
MDTLEAPKLDGFAMAKQWYEKTKPIRGHKDKVRPLGRRRYHQRGNIAMPDDYTVDLNYYHQLFVQWKSDNTFTVRYPRFISAFCIDDLSGFVPPKMWFEWSETRLILCFREGDSPRKYVMEEGDVFQFSLTDRWSYVLHNKKRAFKYSKRRGVTPKIVNERYGAFLDWATVVTGVAPDVTREDAEEGDTKMKNQAGVPAHEALHEFRNRNEKLFNQLGFWAEARNINYLPFSHGGRGAWFHTPSCEVLDSWMTGDPENWPSMLHVIGMRAGLFDWRQLRYRVTMTQLRNFVDNVAMHLFRNEVFAEVELPDGEVPPRTNRRYFTTVVIRDIPTDGRIVQS